MDWLFSAVVISFYIDGTQCDSDSFSLSNKIEKRIKRVVLEQPQQRTSFATAEKGYFTSYTAEVKLTKMRATAALYSVLLFLLWLQKLIYMFLLLTPKPATHH